MCLKVHTQNFVIVCWISWELYTPSFTRRYCEKHYTAGWTNELSENLTVTLVFKNMISWPKMVSTSQSWIRSLPFCGKYEVKIISISVIAFPSNVRPLFPYHKRQLCQTLKYPITTSLNFTYPLLVVPLDTSIRRHQRVGTARMAYTRATIETSRLVDLTEMHPHY